MNRIENWLLNQFGGKLIARAAVSLAGMIAGYVAQAPAQVLLAKGATILGAIGLHVAVGPVDQVALTGLLIGAGQAAFEWFKARRMANPNSPAVQTDPALLPPAQP